jgi:putative ABC transport system permease protein
MVSGREFTRADNETAPLVAVVDETMAAQYWRGQDPVDKRFQMKGRWLQVVGVAKASKHSNLVEQKKPFFYVPMRQSGGGDELSVRTALPPKTVAKLLFREIQRMDANLAPDEVLPMREQMDRTAWTKRATMKLLAIFGGLALLLCAVGLYGVMAYSVSQGTRELGLRMALGARGVDLLRSVISEGIVLIAAGVTLGAVAALSLTRLLGDLLYQTNPRDPLAFAVALAVITLVSLAACFVPAYRASQTDPVRALRASA